MIGSLVLGSCGTRRALQLAGILTLVLGCTTRDRPITPTGPGSGSGPVAPLVTISNPGSDTVVSEGSLLLIRGDVLDDQGVDSVFFDIAGASFTIPPVNVDGAVVLWSFTLQTAGLAGDLLTISVTAKDLDGNYGGPTTRLLSIQ